MSVPPPVVLHHLGALHPVEQWLTLGLAFGPFLVLGVVVWWRRRHPDPGHPPDRSGDDPAATR